MPTRSVASPASNTAIVQASVGGAVLSAIPDFLLAGVCLFTWLRPMAIDPFLVKRLTTLTLLEFIVVHSAPFTGIVVLSDMKRVRKVGAVAGLGAFYMLFAWAFSAGTDSNWPMVAFFALMLNRVLPVLAGAIPSEAQRTYMATCWGVGVVAYLVTVFMAVLLPIPALGVTPDVIAAQRFTSGGLWPEQPWRPLFMGTVYFTLVGTWEIAGMSAIVKRAVSKGNAATWRTEGSRSPSTRRNARS
ncbi:MAG: hypothetical protein IT359_13590 [Gemmatimonadaceae bacterium]|nr:hypothetical protein [Gemmatimonadaceae bacterium]